MERTGISPTSRLTINSGLASFGSLFHLFFVVLYLTVDEDLIKYGWPEDIW